MSSEQQVTTSAEESYMPTPKPTPPLDLNLDQERFARAVAPLAQVAEDGERAADVAQRVEHRKRTLEAYAIAEREVAAEQAPPPKPLDAGLLRDILCRPPEPPFRVDGLIPSNASTLLVAQRKTGKTMLVLNYARSLITGEPLLDTMAVRPIEGRVAILNYEVSGATLARWADEAGIPSDRLYIVNLRGQGNPLADPAGRVALAGLLTEHDVKAVTVDPFGRAFTGTSQNDAGEVGAWLVDLDVFARVEVGATDLVLTTHAGWDGERTRGSTALEDWADSVITLTRDREDESQRYIRAMGRDVELEEDRLAFDPATRRLSLTGTGSRKAGKDARAVEEAAALIAQHVKANPGCSGNDIQQNVSGNNAVLTRARRQLVASGKLIEEARTGKGGGKIYRTTEPLPTSPNVSPGEPTTSPTSPLGERLLREEFNTEPLPAPTAREKP